MSTSKMHRKILALAGLLGGVALVGCAAGIKPPANTTAVKLAGGKFKMGGVDAPPDSADADPHRAKWDPCKGAKINDKFHMSCPEEVQSELIENWVEIKPFWLDTTEVTNFQYRHCVAKGDCSDPEAQEAGDPAKPGHHKGYYSGDKYKQYPVIGVTWEEANDFCSFVGGRLPTEAEWEFAATDGGKDDALVAFGAARCAGDDGGSVAFGKCSSNEALPVGTANADVINGVHDLVGNVQEWVADKFDYLAYCDNGVNDAYNTAAVGKFPTQAGGDPPASLKVPDLCLDNDGTTDSEKYPGKGCNLRLDKCVGECVAWNAGASGFDPDRAPTEFAEPVCRDRIGKAPPTGTDCSKPDDATMCPELADQDLADCKSYCTCVADLATTLAGTDGNSCLYNCMNDYTECATLGVDKPYEAHRDACVDESAAFACLDTQTQAGADPRLRVRPTCLPRGTEAAPIALFEGGKNVAAKTHAKTTLKDNGAERHVFRGAQFQESDACVLRPTRRETYSKIAYSGTVGFRCAYDGDPAAK